MKLIKLLVFQSYFRRSQELYQVGSGPQKTTFGDIWSRFFCVTHMPYTISQCLSVTSRRSHGLSWVFCTEATDSNNLDNTGVTVMPLYISTQQYRDHHVSLWVVA